MLITKFYDFYLTSISAKSFGSMAVLAGADCGAVSVVEKKDTRNFFEMGDKVIDRNFKMLVLMKIFRAANILLQKLAVWYILTRVIDKVNN